MLYTGCMYQPYRPATTRRNKKPEEGVHILACRYLKTNYPEIEFYSDFAAGLHMTINQAKKRKAMNSSRAMPDMHILYPSRGYLGLMVDFKREGTAIYVTKGPRKGELVADEHIREQAAFMEKMNKLGYLVRFCVGFSDFPKLLDWYVDLPKDNNPF
jgi:hypothetical protein